MDFRKLLEAGFAQVNPFDNGADFGSVMRRPASTQKAVAQPKPAPARTQAPGQQRASFRPAQPRPTFNPGKGLQSLAAAPGDFTKGVSDTLVGIAQAVPRAVKAGGLQVRGQAEYKPQGALERAVYGDKPVRNLAGYQRETTSDLGNLATGGKVKDFGANTPEALAIPLGAVLAAGDINPLGGARKKAVKDVTAATTRTRGFTRNVKNSPEVSADTRQRVTGSYEARSTADLATTAEKNSSGNLNKLTPKVHDRLAVPTGTVDDATIADSIAVAKRLDAKGDFDGASHIYDKLAEHGTKQGQSIQAFSLLSNRTPEGMKFHAQRVLKNAKVTLDEAKSKELDSLYQQVRATKPDTEARKMATYQMIQYVNQQVPSGVPDKFINLWRAGLLTAPTTTGGNILGNATEAATRNLWTNPIATGADKMMSLVTGERTKTLAGGNLAGGRQGIQKLDTYLKTGYDERNPLEKYDVTQTTYGDSLPGKAAQKYTDSVYRLMGAADQPFYYAARENTLRDLAGAEAINRGLQGEAKDAFVKEFVSNPPRKVLDKAIESAKYATYQNKTSLGEFVSGGKRNLRQHTRAGGAIADYILPFTQVPAAVAMRIIDRTPVGTVNEVVKQIRRGQFDQRSLAEAIGNGSFGPAVMAAGYSLAQSGDITFGYPEDRKEQELWKMQGKQPYSVRVGDRWYSLNYMQPLGTLLAIGGQVVEGQKNDATTAEQVSSGVATAGQSVMNQSFLKGVSGILDAIDDPQRYAENLWENTAGSVVPNVVRAGARSADPLQRETTGPLEGLLAGIPGVRQNLDPKLDVFGRPLPAKDTFVNQFANPLRPSKVREDDPVVAELNRLFTAGEGILPSKPGKATFKVDGKGVMTPDQVRELLTKAGPELRRAYSTVVSDPRYASLDDAGKRKALDKVNDTVYGAQRLSYGLSKGLTAPDKADPTQLQQQYASGSDVDLLGASIKGKTSQTYGDKFKTAMDDYEKNAKSWSAVQRLKKEKELYKLNIQKDYDDDSVALYGLSKTDALKLMSADGKLAEKAISYGDALVAAGLEKYNKLASWLGIASTGGKKKKSSGRKTAKGGGRKRATFKPTKTANAGIGQTSKKIGSLLADAKVRKT